jgi:hypothetical protein
MNNYINVRLEPAGHERNKNRIKHNFRSVHTQSKLDKSYNNYENKIYNFQDLEPLKVLRKWREEHNTLYKENRYKTVKGKRVKRNENLTNSNSTILEGIITFSEQLKMDLGYKYSKEEWEQTCINVVKEISEYLDTEIMYISFHYDETTPHCHYHFKNYDKKGYSIFHKFNDTEHLSKLQDIGFKHLKKLGMKRGEKKPKTGKTHQKTKQYYIEEQKKLITDLKKIRKKTQELDISTEEKKEIYQEISKLQSEARTELKNIKSQTEELKEEKQGYIKELKVLEKVANQEILNEEEKELLKVLAPAIIQLVPQKDLKTKKTLDNKISKVIR